MRPSSLDDVASLEEQGVLVEVDVGVNADVLVVAATEEVLDMWVCRDLAVSGCKKSLEGDWPT